MQCYVKIHAMAWIQNIFVYRAVWMRPQVYLATYQGRKECSANEVKKK